MQRKIGNLGAVIIDNIRYEFIQDAFEAIGSKQRLLDLGCGVKPYQHIYDKYADTAIGIDVAASPHNIDQDDRIYDGQTIPFNDNEFDIVLCTEVMEHVPEPQLFLHEIHRVLKAGGVLIMTVPFLVPLHEEPHDYYRYTVHGLKHLLKNNGFESISIQSFSEYFGVLISFLVQIQLKFWNVIAKKLRLQVIYTIFNPFILLFVYLPQIAYLKFSRIEVFKNLLNKLSYIPKGYGLIAKRK